MGAGPAVTKAVTEPWPALPLAEWEETKATLHMWTQIVGKVRLALAPPVNHWWHTTLYVTARGLTTSPIPYGRRTFQIDFDFVSHELVIRALEGEVRRLVLEPRPVADFYAELMARLAELGIAVEMWTMPQEVADPIPFDRDTRHASYDPDAANRFWRVLAQTHRVLSRFRGEFLGKCSPVHFFWGAPDLAVTRFSGRPAPPHPGGIPGLSDRVTREAYSHECSSAGFWPGGGPYPDAAFYAYAYPTPRGFAARPVEPEAAFWSEAGGEFLLPYEAVRSARDPDAALLAFLRATYGAAAETGGWERTALERPAGG